MTLATTVYARADRVLSRTTPMAIVLLPLPDGEVIELSGTGVALWEMLEAPATLEELANTLAARFGASTVAIAADLAPSLAELVRCGVVAATEAR